jgi:plasmid replication initiation protein
LTQISKEELYALFYSSKTAGISKIKKWFINGQLKILENVLGNTIQEKVFNLLFPEKSKGCEICKKPTPFPR